MKKFCILLLCVCSLAVACFTACGDKEDKKNSKGNSYVQEEDGWMDKWY